MNNQNDKKILSIEQAATILSETLEHVAKRKTSLKRARTISRLALELSKITEIADLKNRIEFLEQALKKRK